MQAEVIKLYGSIELAPLVGLSEQIVDLVSSGRGYMEVEKESAATFARAAEAAGVEHIIYLGGLADPDDPRLAP